jgi:hypothetical protein
VEDIEDPLTQQVRYLDKLVDELAKNRKMEKILRGSLGVGKLYCCGQPTKMYQLSSGSVASVNIEPEIIGYEFHLCC